MSSKFCFLIIIAMLGAVIAGLISGNKINFDNFKKIIAERKEKYYE